ncbi:hypothetical protein ElyMa_002972900 [Elysia marginata]|uniref:Uncharacterized protein n=1 Tax=Elysia marginata TaxID=1093978 RepID=A0AAV4I956_9GAST|nr:hypothetical protein ElyMa_002972900 [Elysia marginata]
MSGKIIIVIITTIIIIIINGNLSINISSHTNREEKDKKCHWQYKILEWLRWTTSENIFIKSLLFHMQRTVTRTVTVTVSAKQQYLGISAL